ncbi:hypothetical protein JANAI62_10640 [Jannaschia pagri]|uniref:Aggregation factor core n=1 Tax=Jannaschia pagri TaxID=2829797 RepID=A0ABQ4NJD5_9RHOB|nr:MULTISPECIES: hypothetical protein [unclassified Jannaschia]GIT90609.1 hypothetical protein JANAI61_10670 [Jannaschia sp. AI_61]GIT94441.1 hypothetical protein JANAI62_10640 [Jannaschia sp. AI_62]
MIRLFSLLLSGLVLTTTAKADLLVTFRDGAPKDRFVLRHDGGCALERVEVIIDLSPAPAGLIFDITAQGAGVEVFQPFEIVSGADLLLRSPEVRDGDTSLVLALERLTPGAEVAFTIDVDDTLSSRGITVSGSEMAGAVVRLDGVSARFDERAEARLPLTGCLS